MAGKAGGRYVHFIEIPNKFIADVVIYENCFQLSHSLSTVFSLCGCGVCMFVVSLDDLRGCSV